MKNFLNKFHIVFIIAALAVSAAGCGRVMIGNALPSDVLYVVGDEQTSLAEAQFRVIEVMESYGEQPDSFWTMAIGESSMKEYVREGVCDEMLKITVSVLMADKMAVYLTDEEQLAIATAASDAYTRELSKHDLNALNISISTVRSLYTKQALYEKVVERLTENLSGSISQADTKVIEISYVQIPISVALNEVEAMRMEIINGSDFETVCKKYGYSPEMIKVTARGEMPSAVDNIAFALYDGEISEIIETDSGLYLVQCVEDYLISESEANYNRVLSDAKNQAFSDYYESFTENIVIRFNADVWNEINILDL